jgi:ABC-type lipoprotein export system ATPase subunit
LSQRIQPKQSLAVPSGAPRIEVQDLHKAYRTSAGAFPALRGIDMRVWPGEFVAVHGKSGAGKSTLINMITGIDRPSSGDVLIDGVSIHAMADDQLARWRGKNLGVVFQFFQLLPSLSLIENITLAMDFSGGYPIGERRDRALELLAQVGLVEHARKVPSKISGGQQQRVAIARALANDPGLLVADEPTGNLDSHTAGEIMGLFEDLVQRGRTLLIVTHDRELSQRASRVIEIEDGMISSEGYGR